MSVGVDSMEAPGAQNEQQANPGPQNLGQVNANDLTAWQSGRAI